MLTQPKKPTNLQFVGSSLTTPNLMYRETGEYNGYVAVPPEHPLYGKGDSAEEVEALDVHGGVTYTGKIECLPYPYELLDHKEIPRDWWVFGFDTCHYGDKPDEWNLERCTEETRKLQKQLEELFAHSE